MLTTLNKGLIKTGFLTALAIFLSNILVSASYLYLADTKLFIPDDALFWGRLLVLLFLPGVICFAVGMRTAHLTGDATIGWAMSCSACLIAGITTVVVIGLYVIFSSIIPELSSFAFAEAGRGMVWGFFYVFLAICGAVFIFAQGLCCGVLAGWVGSKLGERGSDEPSDE